MKTCVNYSLLTTSSATEKPSDGVEALGMHTYAAANLEEWAHVPAVRWSSPVVIVSIFQTFQNKTTVAETDAGSLRGWMRVMGEDQNK